MFEIGKIVNTQGLKGEIRVIPTTDEPSRFGLLKEINVYFKDKHEVFEIERMRLHKQFVLLKLKGLDSINDVERLKNTSIKLPKQEALPLQKDEYYIGDLYGLKVVTDEGEDLGNIKDIIFTGANDVYVVEKQEQKDLLIPAIKKCILSVNLEDKIITVKLLEGLRSL